MKILLFSYLFACVTLFGQPQKNHPSLLPIIPFETEVITIPQVDSSFSLYYIYKIPYRLLVFERNEESYNASFRIIVEVSDDDGKLVTRDIKDNKIVVNKFEETSEKNLFLQDYLSFKVDLGNYKVGAIISDMNSSDERPLKPFDIKLDKESEKLILQPIVTVPEEIKCNENNAVILANFGGKIPFSSDKFNLIIPLTDTSITEIEVIMKNNDEEVYSGKIVDSYVDHLGIENCEGKIIFTSASENVPTRNFVLKYVNKNLNEGKLLLQIKNDEKQIDEKLDLNVVWFNKPFSLFNPEKAIELLSYIETEDVIDDLLSADEPEYPKVLQNYWAKYDPTPETSFNEIMSEYYNRIDYAIKEFSSISNNNGAKTDRGMVYIRFGEPDTINRTSNSQGEVIEIWIYSNTQRKFTFIDKIGTGNFTLTEN